MGDAVLHGVPIIVNLTPSEVTTAAQGAQVEMLINVRNADPRKNEFVLEVEGLDEAWYTIDEQRFTLFAGDSKTVAMSLHPPSNVELKRYVFDVKARSQTDSNLIGITKGAIKLVPAPVVVDLQSSEVSIIDGMGPYAIEATLNISSTLTGVGPMLTADQYKVIVEGLDPAWYTLEVATVALFWGDSARIPIKLHPPKRNNTSPESYDLVVRASSNTEALMVGSAKCSLTIMPYPIRLGLAPARAVVAVDEQPIQMAINIENVGTVNDEYSLEAENLPTQWQISENKVSLAPGTKTSVSLLLQPPIENQTVVGEHKFTIRAQSTTDHKLIAEISGIVEVVGNPVEVTLTPPRIEVKPGNPPVAVSIVLRNISPLAQIYNIRLDAANGSWLALDTQNTSLLPNDSIAIPLRVSVPKSNSAQVGDYSYKVAVRSQGRPTRTGAVTATGIIAVLPYMEFQAVLKPEQATGEWSTHTITLQNEGNYDLQVKLVGRDKEAALLYDFDMPHVGVLANISKQVRFRLYLKPSQTSRFVQGHKFEFIVEAQAIGPDGKPDSQAGVKTLKGRLDYTPPIKPQPTPLQPMPPQPKPTPPRPIVRQAVIPPRPVLAQPPISPAPMPPYGQQPPPPAYPYPPAPIQYYPYPPVTVPPKKGLPMWAIAIPMLLVLAIGGALIAWSVLQSQENDRKAAAATATRQSQATATAAQAEINRKATATIVAQKTATAATDAANKRATTTAAAIAGKTATAQAQQTAIFESATATTLALIPPSMIGGSGGIVGQIETVPVDYDVLDDTGKKGMRIHVKFTVDNAKDMPCQATAYFYDQATGVTVKNTDPKYSSLSGDLAVSSAFTPGFDQTVYNDFLLFMPYEQIRLTGEHKLYFIIQAYVLSPYQLIISSEKQPFIFK